MDDVTMPQGAIGHGIATLADDGVMLDCWFPQPALQPEPGTAGTVRLDAAQAAARLSDHPGTAPRSDAARGVVLVPVTAAIADLSQPPVDAGDAYLRLHLLSHRLVRPRGLNLDGMFGLLANVAWTTYGPCLPERLEALRWHARAQGTPLGVRSVDRIPRMTDYVVPAGVRIADANRVRLGAHLSAGTTVMHEGFCNFNAGTLGASMVEGRISAGVIVGEGTDIGGGASIMGTLSGGGREMITIGERCLLGANSGLGIALGDDCVIEAGCYVTAGTLVRTPDGEVVKAATLSGRDGLLFRRHSQTGAVEAIMRKGSWGALNPMLHAV